MHSVWYPVDIMEKTMIEMETKTTQPWQTYWREIRIFRLLATWHVLFIDEPLATIPTANDSPKNVCRSTKSCIS